MKKRKGMQLLLGGVSAFLLLGAGVLGYWKQTGSTMNILTTGAFQNQIMEKYEIPSEVNPGDSIEKMVNVTNTGNVASIIRVAVTKVFGDSTGKGEFAPDLSLDPEVIQIDYADTWWKQGKDGYFYYKEILKPGKTTREPLFESYTLSQEAGNEYKGKDARIIVTLESIQADMDPEKTWGVSCKDLGLVPEEGANGQDTKVAYQGKNGGFSVTESTTDLFASFKLLLPGCTRTQNIILENQSDEKVELFLRAEEPEQTILSSEQRDRIHQLLYQDAWIRIREGDALLYAGPVAGNAAGKSMQQDISLGYFQAKEKKNLTVSLEMNPQMKMEAGNLSAKVRWIFTAKGEDGTTVGSQSVPKTGDSTGIFAWIMALTGSAGLLVTVLLMRKKRRC